jgi:hypothetical protein
MPINSFLYPGIKFIAPYTIANSCRFNDGDSPQHSKSVGSSATTKYTLSLWVKRGIMGTYQRFFTSTGGSGLGDTYFRFNENDTMEISGHGSNAAGGGYVITNRVFQDPGAWMHIVVRYDSTQGTANDRFRLYINGVDERNHGGYSTDTMPNQNVADNITANGNTLRIGAAASAQYFDGYMAEVHFSEGQSYAPTEFGEYNSDSPTIWQPKEASISYGTSGFYLDFEDSANLGNDKNGGTDLSETNIAAADQATDTPTNNFCTMNPLDNYYTVNSFAEGNCQVITASSGYTGAQATMGVAAGKWYFEFSPISKTGDADEYTVGVVGTPFTGTGQTTWHPATGYGYVGSNGNTYNNDSVDTSGYGDTYTAGDIIGVALDVDNSKLYWSKGGTWQNSGDPTTGATGTGAESITAVASTPTKFYFPSCAFAANSASATLSLNFGGCPAFSISSGNADANGYGNFEYAPPTGYYALCSKNLGEFG